MLTPEVRAKEIAKYLSYNNLFGDEFNPGNAEQMIADAIRAAVKEERARAKVDLQEVLEHTNILYALRMYIDFL